MRPRLVSVYFPCEEATDRWDRLADVLRASAERWCAGWDVSVTRIEASRSNPQRSRNKTRNTHKLDHWGRIVETTPDGTNLLLIDADTLICRSIDDIWDRSFDVAITTKTDRFPLNGGVVSLRVSPAVRAFIAAWVKENRRMFDDPEGHRAWLDRLGGVNQSSLVRILEERRFPQLAIERLPCLEWNCEDSSWARFDPATTRIVHYKGLLRAVALGGHPLTPEIAPLVKAWRAIDQEVRSVARSA